MDAKTIGTRLREALRLKTRPIAVYGADAPPAGGAPSPSVDRCLATVMYLLATGEDPRPLYIGSDEKQGCCPGGLSHTGYIKYPPSIKYFVSTGKPEYRGGEAEYLKANPDAVERCFLAVGKVRPPGRYLVMQACGSLSDPSPLVQAITFFGTAEEVRNLGALVHFDRSDPFSPVIVPWGPVCSTLITYPAGLAAKAPKETAFMGPQDPTLNRVLPEDTMALGVPIAVAERMAENASSSFVVKRPDVAFHGSRR
jgi:hypothetical protein